MPEYHINYTDESLRKHREYLKEIIKYLKKHLNELNLYPFIEKFQGVLGKEDPIYKRVTDVLIEEPFLENFDEMLVRDINGDTLNFEEFHDYFVEKFPQWKDIYYY